MTAQVKSKTKIKKIRDSARASGFGFDYKRSDDERKPTYRKAKEITLKFIDTIDSELEQLTNEEDKEEFLDDINYKLGGIMACIYDSTGWGYRKRNPVRIPEDIMKACDYSYHYFLDHFTKDKVPTPHQNSKTYEYKYTSNPYSSIDSCYLEKVIPALKKIGYNFEISAESNYFPGRTLQIRFDKAPKK